MPRFHSMVLVVVGCVMCSGCGAAKIKELSAEVERLKASVAALEKAKAQTDAELAKAKQDLSQVEEIKRGYEDARAKFAASLKPLAALTGNVESPLPPFEGLKDSSWVGKLTPGAGLPAGIKELEKELKGLLGEEAKKPVP